MMMIGRYGALMASRAIGNFHSGNRGIHATLNSRWELPGISEFP